MKLMGSKSIWESFERILEFVLRFSWSISEFPSKKKRDLISFEQHHRFLSINRVEFGEKQTKNRRELSRKKRVKGRRLVVGNQLNPRSVSVGHDFKHLETISFIFSLSLFSFSRTWGMSWFILWPLTMKQREFLNEMNLVLKSQSLNWTCFD